VEQLTNGFLDTSVDWTRGLSKHMRLRDFPTFLRTTDRDDPMLNFVMHEIEHSADAAAIMYNIFDELEQPAIDALPPATYTVGPLNQLAEQLVPVGGPLDALVSNLWKEDRTSLDWLDGKEPQSVVYVNYGSITVMTNEQLVEFAWGLANSSYTLLWIIRPDLVKGDTTVLPPEFTEATRERGLLASWCPQKEVLRHEAVGLFLTHNGWNSTLESLSCVVPMLTWPFFADQQINSRYMCMEWGVAMEVGDDVQRQVVHG
jgi:UDP:flavonoid glycosyltransferase YjiC (YdhE family)